MDQETLDDLSPIASDLGLVLYSEEELVDSFPELKQAKANRSAVEFFFTCTPFLLKHSMKNKSYGHLSIYLDADLYFFGDPGLVVREIEDSSVAIIEHNYPWHQRALSKKYGTYNVGLLSIRNDSEGMKTLNWWSERCLEWCHDYPEDGKYADQGYLDSFQEISTAVKVLQNPAFNLAPWNTASSKLVIQGDSVLVDGNSLSFFHFHGLKKKNQTWISSQLNYLSPLPRETFHAIYGPYLEHIEKIQREVAQIKPLSNVPVRKGSGLRGAIANGARAVFRVLSVVFGQTFRIRESNGEESRP